MKALPRWTVWNALLVLALIRLAYLPWFCHITDLAGDEAYYWEWGRRLDWGYYSKPPMIGWLMGAVGRLSGNAEWAVRLSALVFGTASLALLTQLAQRQWGRAAAGWTLLLAALAPGNIALNLFFTIDAPLVFCWSAALLLFWLAVESPRRWSLWLLLWGVLGLGYLSKQMMLVFPVLMLVFVSVHRPAWPLLLNLRFWACSLGSLVFLIPVLNWNQAHQWITLQHTQEHFTGQPFDWGQRLSEFLLFPVVQAAMLSPLSALLIVCALGLAVRRWRMLSSSESFAVVFTVPGLLIFVLLAMRQYVIPNWPAVYYLAALPLAGQLLACHPRWQRPVGVSAAVFALLGYCSPLLFSVTGQEGGRLDPVRRLRGWQETGQQMGQMLSKVPRPEATFLLVLGHRDPASLLAFYTLGHPSAFRWQPDGRITSQYELWPSAGSRLGDDALMVLPRDKTLPAALKRAFDEVIPWGEIDAAAGQLQRRQFKVYWGRNLRHWPLPERG
jgi:4-amino-4-deoxy-L-arabinose transferase-like glycosyltransferase